MCKKRFIGSQRLIAIHFAIKCNEVKQGSLPILWYIQGPVGTSGIYRGSWCHYKLTAKEGVTKYKMAAMADSYQILEGCKPSNLL